MVLNQDLRDHICEFAVSDVATACAVRSVGRGWRLAADRRIRNLVAMGQPQLVPNHDAPTPWDEQPRYGSTTPALPPLTLDVSESENDELDHLRFAVTCDQVIHVLRLAIVAFALDGAKDQESDEVRWCGPRLLQIGAWQLLCERIISCTVGNRKRDGSVTDWTRRPTVARSAYACYMWDRVENLSPKSVSAVMEARAAGMWTDHNPTELCLSYGALDDPKCIGFARHFAPSIKILRLGFRNKGRISDLACNLFRAFKHVTDLSLDFFQSIGDDGGDEFDGDPLVHLYDTFIASGAQIKTLRVEGTNKPCALAGFLNYMPSLTDVQFHVTRNRDGGFVDDLTFALSDNARARLTRLAPIHGATSPVLCRAGYISVRDFYFSTSKVFPQDASQATWWDERTGPRESLDRLRVGIEHPLPLRTDFGALFQNVTDLTLDCRNGSLQLENVVPGLPLTLRRLRLRLVTRITEWLRASLTPKAGHGAIPLEEAWMDGVDDVAGLMPVAGSIRRLRVNENHETGQAANVAQLVLACAPNLVSLHLEHPRHLDTSVVNNGQLPVFPALRRLIVTHNRFAPSAAQQIFNTSKRLHYVVAAGLDVPAPSHGEQARWHRQQHIPYEALNVGCDHSWIRCAFHLNVKGSY